MRSPLRFWVLAALLTANLVVGVLSLYFVRSVNHRYAALFEYGAPVIYNLRTYTREVTAVQRYARRVLTPAHEAAWSELLPQMAAAQVALESRADAFDNDLFKGSNHPAAIVEINREYRAHVQQFLKLAREGRLEEAEAFNIATLRPCHDRFQQVLDSAADYVEVQGRDLRDRYARDSRFFGGVSLAFASVPLLAIVGGVLVMTVLIGLLLLVVINPRPDRRRA
jgi:hypothetical protein